MRFKRHCSDFLQNDFLVRFSIAALCMLSPQIHSLCHLGRYMPLSTRGRYRAACVGVCEWEQTSVNMAGMHCFCSTFWPPHMSHATHCLAATARNHAALLSGSLPQHRCQVVALRLRSAARAGDPAPDPRDELDYPALLNRALPSDIRVLGWAPVPAGFSARFSTLHRTYRRGSCAKLPA